MFLSIISIINEIKKGRLTTMKNYILGFGKEFNREGKGWYISHRENGTLFSTLSCKLDDKIVYVSNTKEVQNEIDRLADKDTSIQFSSLQAVPLFRKSLITLKQAVKEKNVQSLSVYVEAEEGKKIAEINLRGCASCYYRNTGSKVAMIIYAPNNKWSMEIIQTDGKTITVDSATGKIHNGHIDEGAVKRRLVLKIKKTLYLPKNVLIARAGDKTIPELENHTSVSIAQLLSKSSLVLGHPENIVLDDSLNDKDKEDVKVFFKNRMKIEL